MGNYLRNFRFTKPLNYANLTLFPSNTMYSPGAFRLVLRTNDWSIVHHNIIIYVQDIEHMLWTFSCTYSYWGHVTYLSQLLPRN